MSTHDENHKENSNINTLSNDEIHVTVTTQPHCLVKFDIHAEPKMTQRAYQDALKNVRKEVSIPGFRKGRAPDTLLQDRYASAIHKEFIETALQMSFQNALQLTHIHPLKDGHVERPIVHECTREKGAHFTIEFECRPVIPSVNLSEIKIKKVTPVKITNEELENALNNLVIQFAKYEPVTDRPVQEEDFIDISLTILEDPPREIIHRQRTQVNAKGMPEWLRQKVLGLKLHESAEGMTEQNSSVASDSLTNAESLPFRVTVLGISQGDLPAIDDELAKRVGLSTLDELHVKIKEKLENEAQKEAFQQSFDQIEKSLVNKYPIEIPQSYIQSDIKSRLEGYKQQIQERGEELPSNFKEIEESIKKISIFRLQAYFLLRKIAAEYGIEVTNEDISRELNYQLSLLSQQRCEVDFSAEREQQIHQLRNLALDRKIGEFLVKTIQAEE